MSRERPQPARYAAYDIPCEVVLLERGRGFFLASENSNFRALGA